MNQQKRKTYDTRVKYLVRKGLLPDLFRKQIHRSLLWKSERESPDKYVGYELNNNIDELYELMKKISMDDKMQKTLKAFYRINKTLKDIIGTGKDYLKKIREHKYQIIDAINRGKKSIGIKRGIKLFGIILSTFRTWSMETYFRCGQSLTQLCNTSYPQQLTVKEIHKMHRMLSDEKYLHWPIISVAYYGMKKLILKAHPNTWYKYARLMKIKRKRHKKIHRKYEEGVRANAPNEKWHADITELKTEDGKISYIYIVRDNFARYITSWRVADRVCAKIRLDTFAETIKKAGIKPISKRHGKTKNETELIVDGGTENNIRPHGSLHGLTPLEAYKKKKVNFKKIREKMIEAHHERIKFNQTHSCFGCPFGCKQ